MPEQGKSLDYLHALATCIQPMMYVQTFTGQIRGWAFGDDKTIACANVAGKFYAVDGRCPRCAFDLYKGKLLTDKEVRKLLSNEFSLVCH